MAKLCRDEFVPLASLVATGSCVSVGDVKSDFGVGGILIYQIFGLQIVLQNMNIWCLVKIPRNFGLKQRSPTIGWSQTTNVKVGHSLDHHSLITIHNIYVSNIMWILNVVQHYEAVFLGLFFRIDFELSLIARCAAIVHFN